MTDIYDNRPRRTEADVDSETRFGTRHVPKGHRASAPYRPSHLDPRRVIPSGDLAPDGRPYPAPSLTARILVWGGIGVAAAAATAGTILAARKIADAVSGGDDDRRRDDASLDAAHQRLSARSLARIEAEERARAAARAGARRRVAQPSFLREVRDTTQGLSGGLLGLIGSLNAAVTGFRAVAQQASGIIREFSDSADSVRHILDRQDQRAARFHDDDNTGHHG
ncbi:hypothetical protein [Paracoccus jiaweipingae]|uniref:hypothetical protein n=1 Tax=unclassified Paracoccus (in: a-proteobacteria) TaxID=2688777 RepID=UPI0037A0DA29